MTKRRIGSAGLAALAVFSAVLSAWMLSADRPPDNRAIRPKTWLRVVFCVEGALGLIFAFRLLDFWEPSGPHELMWRLIFAMLSVACFRKCWQHKRMLTLPLASG
jgi:hypothetical protein